MNKAEHITIEWRRFADFSAPLLYELLWFRQAIFVVEQASPYPDLDGDDQAARHLLLRIDGRLAGCLRLIAADGRVRIGRLAVAPAQRRGGLGRRLMAEALAVQRRDHPGCPVEISAQAHLARFYAGLGFAAVSAEYDDYGIPHIDMVRRP